MDEEVIEGEVMDPEDPWQDPRIAFEVEDFQQRMDEMKQAYLFAADMIGRGVFHPPSKPEVSSEPVMVFDLIRICGERLIAVGSWLLEKCPTPAEDSVEGKRQENWAWADQTHAQRPVRLPRPEVNRSRGL